MRGKVSDRAPIIVGIMSGMSAKAVANECGCSLPMVYKVAGEIGYEWPERENAITGKEDKIRDMMAEGLTRKQIAVELGIGFYNLNYHCRTKEIKSGKWERTPDKIDGIIRSGGSQVRYVGGYAGRKTRITVQCDKCGEEFSTPYQRIIAHKVECPNCKAAEREEKNRQFKTEQEERKRQATEERKRKSKERAEKRAKQAKEEAERKYRERLHPCIVCGAETHRPKYCSNKCANKAENKRHEVMRRAKIKNAMVDKDITIESLYKRDGGVCYICGLKCRLDDYVMRDNTFIAGDWYPSIDHVQPLAKGGEHSWANVRLAHRRCNSLKADKVSP